MSMPWRPEREVTVEQARDAIERSGYPGPLDSVVIATAGWDNTVVLVDDDWVFRFPRREIALPGIHREINWLPQLAPQVPLPIPLPTHSGVIGEPGWPFWGGRFLAGTELAHSPHADRVGVAGVLGTFVAALHALPVPGELPVDPMRRADAASRSARATHVLADLRDAGLWSGNRQVEQVLAGARDLGPCGASVVFSHGDLYSRHVLIDDVGQISGVIDWGDLCAASPAADLAIAFSAFRGEARAVLLDAYGPLDSETLLRAQTMGIFSAASVAAYAHDTGDSVLLREALTGLAGAGQD